VRAEPHPDFARELQLNAPHEPTALFVVAEPETRHGTIDAGKRSLGQSLGSLEWTIESAATADSPE
jgi:hypothetical protein